MNKVCKQFTKRLRNEKMRSGIDRMTLRNEKMRLRNEKKEEAMTE